MQCESLGLDTANILMSDKKILKRFLLGSLTKTLNPINPKTELLLLPQAKLNFT